MDCGSIRKRAARAGSRGQILPLVAVALVVLFGAAALAVDAGYLRYKHRLQQTATDSAAVAGAVELLYPASTRSPNPNPSASPVALACALPSGSVPSSTAPQRVTVAAWQDASCNWFTDDGGTTTGTVGVTVNNPPLQGSYVGNAQAVEVIIDAKQPTFFERIFGVLGIKEATRAVALLRPGGDNCVLALFSSGLLSLNSSTVNAPNCAFLSNGRLSVNGGATITAAQIGAVGNIQDQSGTFPLAQPLPSISSADPCPTIAGCEYLATHTPDTSTCIPDPGTTSPPGTALTLTPGVYCSLSLAGRSVVFNSLGGTNPPLYVVAGGMTGNSQTSLTGNGVTFYIAGGKVDMNNVSSFNLAAPTSGNTNGILFYQPPSNTTGPANLNSSHGTLAGMLYFPSIHMNTNASITSYFSIVAGDANINGATISIPATNLNPGQQHVVLAE